MIQSILEQLKPSGQVLQIGYGDGRALEAIHKAKPQHITLIERHREEMAKAELKNYKDVTLLEDTWENAMPKLKTFNAVLFHEAIVPTGARETGHLLVEQGEALIQRVKRELPQISSMRYSDADLKMLLEKEGNSPTMERFLKELHHNGQVSNEQYDRLAAKYNWQGTLNAPVVDPINSFIKLALAHTSRGSRIVWMGMQSKFEDPAFFEAIISNPSYEYTEKAANGALLMTLTIQQ